MSSKVEACPKCTQRCLHFHRKTSNLSSVTSFFKVMFGDHFSEVLSFPPMFAARVSGLVDKKVVLEDSLGQKWKVTVSNCDGSLAFQEGWSVFSLEHSVEIGDFLIFNHIMDLHFNVTIYSKTGCEKVKFPKNGNMRKRTRSDFPVPKKTNEDLTNPQVSCPSVGSGSIAALSQDKYCVTGSRNVIVNQDKRPKCERNNEGHGPLCRTDTVDDSYCFINRNEDTGTQENGRLFLDLFSMEMPMVNSCINENTTNKASGDELNPNFVNNTQVDVKGDMRVLPLNLSAIEIVDKIQCSEEADIKLSILDNDPPRHDKNVEVPFTTSATNSDGNVKNFCHTPLKMVNDSPNVLAICDTPSTITRQDQDSKRKPSFSANHCHGVKLECSPNSMEVENRDVYKTIKAEPLEIKIEVNSYEDFVKKKMQPKVEEELLEKPYRNCRDYNCGADSIATPAHVSCIVAMAKDTLSFLELSTSLYFPCSRSRRNLVNLVFLRDPRRRLWPVRYHDKPNVHVLTSGWKAFCSANKIEPGDECMFRVEDESRHIFEVSVRNRKS